MKFMHSPQLKSRVRTLSALVAASIVLPALAYADRDNDKDSHRENNGRGDNDEIMRIGTFRLSPKQTQGGS